MPPSGDSRQGARLTLAPPEATSGKPHRTGYLALAASGLLTATAFAGIADLATGSMDAAREPSGVHQYERDPDANGPDRYLVPGQAHPEGGQEPIDDAAARNTLRPSEDDSIGTGLGSRAGSTTTLPTLLSPEADRSDDGSNGGHDPDGTPSEPDEPEPTRSEDPGPTSTTTSSTEPPTTDPTSTDPTGPTSTDPTPTDPTGTTEPPDRKSVV